ncbi:MAG: hypothetical protein ISR90_06705 [Candidatus Marinimicrobia bacterium]|nr:hypothetical protein [Candidatus Neomarinimicrobiota bacterium]MBL7023722.1 hypothetical protein [Candidatus Neomarinimicrobiota bacterium]MBL7109503.1 hypothetical protein [Candidatus Neomarinimicrobiota bacterium]
MENKSNITSKDNRKKSSSNENRKGNFRRREGDNRSRYSSEKKRPFRENRQGRGRSFNHRRIEYPDWIKVLKVNPIPKILDSGKPADILALQRNILGMERMSDPFRQLEKRVNHQEKLQKLFRDQIRFNDEKKNISTKQQIKEGLLFHKQLSLTHHLMQLGGRKYYGPVRDVILALMKFQREDGRFPLLYHHHAHACWLLLKLGLEGNRILDRAIFWIVNRQREDGGWLHRSMTPKAKEYQNAESCIWTSAEILQMLSHRNIYISKDVTKRACEFLLSKVLHKNSTSLFPSEDTWDHLSASIKGDAMFLGGTLKVLDSVVRCGYNPTDQRVKKMYNWLLEQQMDNGLFPAIAGKMPQANYDVTVRVLEVIKSIETTRPKQKPTSDIIS